MKPSIDTLFKPKPSYETLREEAVQIIEKELAQEENMKKRMQQHQEERVRIEQSWREAEERQAREKKEEEERERQQLEQQKADPDKPLTIKDLRAIPGFYYEDYRRALDDLNVEILKRIARKTYAHKFDIKVNT
jgi:cation transport ATPase